MRDATLAQGKMLFELSLREPDPRAFLQRLIENWGIVQIIGRGKFDQTTLKSMLNYILSLVEGQQCTTFLEEIMASREEERGKILKILNTINIKS